MTKKTTMLMTAALPMVGMLAWFTPRSTESRLPTAVAHDGPLASVLREPGTVSSARLLL